MNQLLDLSAAAARISAGESLFVAGDEHALAKLPRGAWIGGTIPYFIDPAGGTCDRERVFVHALPGFVTGVAIEDLTDDNLAGIYGRIPPGGFALAILPAFSALHARFALEAPRFPGFATGPLVGWISGLHLDDLGKAQPKVINGRTGELSATRGVACHVRLPADRYADLGIVNLFTPGKGPEITFDQAGFAAKRARVDGVDVDFAAWCRAQGVNVQLPLVADYAGAMINVSFQAIADDHVDFYAPVFPGVSYRQAAPVGDYPTEFAAHTPDGDVVFACNCILNYLYAGLEGRKTSVHGPATFGEIAYQLLNQTLVHVRFHTL